MKINTDCKKYIDKKSIELVNLVEKLPIFKQNRKELMSGSVREKVFVNWTDKFDNSKPLIWSITSYCNKKFNKWIRYNGIKLGYGYETYKEYVKFIKSIHKQTDINKLVTFNFLDTEIFSWIIDTYKNSRSRTNLSQHIEETIINNVVKQTYCFPILNLDISQKIKIGKVVIKYLTKEDFDKLFRSFQQNNRKNENTYESLRKKYQGMVVASSEVYGQPEKAQELALENCLLAIDILKICSDTIEIPDLNLSFDIGNRLKEQLCSECLTYESNSLNNLEIKLKVLPNHHEIDDEYLKRINKRYFQVLENFISQDSFDNELSNLIVNAIKKFAFSLSNKDLNWRIVEIFSIYESLLLPNENAHIQNSLTKYGSKLIYKTPEERTSLKKLIIYFYKIRSAMVHHGKRKNIDLLKLKELQLALLLLIVNLIYKNKTHENKKTILNEIDNAINEAY
ncbi:MAG: hypothetical protein JEY97_01435 [Bacteroidales bacterium]|nr:hypothetical protein [Bacteroidales bacterium]